MTVRLGELLVERGVLTPTQRDVILEHQRATGRPFGELAERLFGVSPRAVEAAWAHQYAAIATWVDPRTEPADPEALRLIDRRQAWQFGLLPLRFEGDEVIACTTPHHLVRALRFAGWRLDRLCSFVLAEPEALAEAIMRHHPLPGMGPESLAARRSDAA